MVALSAFLLLVAVESSTAGVPVISFADACFSVRIKGVLVLENCRGRPVLFVGSGITRFTEHHGNFIIDDYVIQRIPLSDFVILNDTAMILSNGPDVQVTVHIDATTSGELSLSFSEMPPGMDRAWLRIKAEANEMVFGGGEQYSHFNLRGRAYPIWTREQGVGRNKKTYITFMADVHGPDAGGDYHTTYFPQPTFVSSRRYYAYSSSLAYAVLDFTNADYHELEIHGPLPTVYLEASDSMADLVARLSRRLGLQPPLPEWIRQGAILGLQGGTDIVLQRLLEAEIHGARITAVWIQDWVGRLVTSFGSRLFWDWVWNRILYPDLDVVIRTLAAKNIRVLAYINPHLNTNGTLFRIAEANGYLVRNMHNGTYVADFGEFFCGTVDLTNPSAFEWYKGIIKKNMIDFGFSGWMADFGEYLPASGVIFHDGSSAADIAHNKWPLLWARANREAVEESGMLGDVVYFMRAGFSGVQNYSTLTWAGDQNVDFSLDDGLASTIPAALSLGLSGVTMTHFDIGGYTSLAVMHRTKELLLRSAEAAVFTPVMRTHEGNRPNASWQVYSDEDTWRQFTKLTELFVTLSPYREAVLREASEVGLPAQRPLMMHYENDSRASESPYQYLFGRDMLVAPVIHSNVTDWQVYLPADEWIHVWSSDHYRGPLDVTVKAPLGQPPVFYRSNSRWSNVICKLANCIRSNVEL